MQNLTETVLPIIKKTRDITLPHFGKAKIIAMKSSSPHDAVTKLDNEVEIFLREELKKVYPDIAFVGEEFGGNRESGKFWIADPIDGTASYIKGIPFCTSMLALVDNGLIIFSVIYDFVNDNMYHAEKGKGAYKNGTAIHVSNRDNSEAYIGWESRLDKSENLKVFLELRKLGGMIKLMCCGLEYAMIAEGKLEGRITFDPWGNDYDYAPGSLLVEEAGGVVANIGSKTYDYKNYNFIAASPSLYKKLTESPDALFPLTINKVPPSS